MWHDHTSCEADLYPNLNYNHVVVPVVPLPRCVDFDGDEFVLNAFLDVLSQRRQKALQELALLDQGSDQNVFVRIFQSQDYQQLTLLLW
jgi:hypothetical protein